MKPEIVTITGSIQATTAVTKKRFVTHAGAQAGAAVAALGVAGDNVAAGEWLPVKGRGWLVVTSGGAIAVGAQVESDANGKAVTLAAGVALGRAIDAATAADQDIRIER